MPDQTESPRFFNPFMLWTDWSMRATDAALASTQNITDGADRVTRAVAGAETGERPRVSAGSDAGTSTAVGIGGLGGIGGIATMQRMAWELAAQNWSRWMSTVTNLMSTGAGIGVAQKLTGRDNPLQAVRDSLRPASWGEKPVTNAGDFARALAAPEQRRKSRSGTATTERALAAAEPKPRRKAAAKTGRTKRASRK